MTNQEKKLQHWNKIKNDLANKLNLETEIELKGMDDDSEYYHPIINLDSEYFIKGQCSNGHHQIYALTFCSRKNKNINLNLDEDFYHIKNNWKQIKPSILEVSKKIISLKNLSHSVNAVILQLESDVIKRAFTFQNYNSAMKKAGPILTEFQNDHQKIKDI